MNKELSLSGSPGSPGIVIGKTSLYQRKQMDVSSGNIEDGDVEHQIEHFKKAREKAGLELQELLREQEDETVVELIHTQIEMINDPDLCNRVEAEIVENNKAADSAIKKVFKEYLEVMTENRSERQLNQTSDITDIRDRLIQLVNHHPVEMNVVDNTILVAGELSPREVIEFADYNIRGIIMGRGGPASHAAIIARSMNIPAVVGLKKAVSEIDSGEKIILDGNKGTVIFNPEEQSLKEYQKLIEQELEAKAELEAICAEPSVTKDDHPFILRANIEFAEELNLVKQYRAEGIGLLRTESMYLRGERPDSQQKQELFYKSILERTDSYPVTIRLFDVGGDKFFDMRKEQNPFLGWRGIRMLLDDEELLVGQLKAILKTAGQYPGRLQILVPMVSSLDEVLLVKKMITRAQKELREKGIAIDENVPFGIMVEVPGVAMQAEVFAKHVDFLSIGTNDLTQYMFAVDRGNELISSLYDQRHPAIWQIIKKVSDAANGTNLPLAVCGELASDPVAACCLIGLGINELSMNPTEIPAVKKILRSHSLKEMQQLAAKVLKSETVADIDRLFNNWT